MKIAVIAPTEIPARRANSIQVMKMSQAFTALNHQTCVVSPFDKTKRVTPPDTAWEDLARHYGLQYRFPIKWLPARGWLRRYDYGISAVWKARKFRADIVYTRLPQSAALASTLGMDTILEAHDLPQGTAGKRIFNLFLNNRGARRLVVITHALAHDLSERFRIPASPQHGSSFLIVLPDGVDLERYDNPPTPMEARRELVRRAGEGEVEARLAALDPDRLTAGYTGHMYPGRGTALLIALAERLPEINFLLIGGEPHDVSRLQEMVTQRNLENVTLLGFIPNQELPHYQAACDMLMMPYQQRVAASSGGDISRYLSPMKLFEYMACGRVILSSDLPVFREVLNDQNAILLPGDDLDVWVESVSRLQTDETLRMRLSNQAREDAKSYSWTARAEKLLAGLDPQSA